MNNIYVYPGLAGTDTVKGTPDDDAILSRRNNATIYGYGGNDSINISTGSENVVYAGNGNDYVLVDSAYTTVDGGAGNDEIDVKRSNVSVNGGAGDDEITINNLSQAIKNVTLSGGGGNNTFSFNRHNASRNDKPISFVITDLHNGDVIRSLQSELIELEYSTAGGNLVLTEVGNSEANITLKSISDISQVSDVVFRTKGESKTLGEIFSNDNEPDPIPEPVTLEPVTPDPEPVTLEPVTPNPEPVTLEPVTPNPEPVTVKPVTPDPEPVTIKPVTPEPEPVTVQPEPIIQTVKHTYNGGNKIISNYSEDDIIRLNSDYQGIELNGNSFFVKSSSGQLEIQNSRDKFITYSSGNDDDIVAYSYMASSSGTIDGRKKHKAEIMIGANNADNQIYAGGSGSSLWGGVGGNDTLTGGIGYDEFFYAMGDGNDVIEAGYNDLINLASINLSQISSVDVSIGQVDINFVDGCKLQIHGYSYVNYRIAEGTFQVSQATKKWSAK